MSAFWSELRRRNVFKVAASYASVASAQRRNVRGGRGLGQGTHVAVDRL